MTYTLDDYWKKVAISSITFDHWRVGQASFNVLVDMRPDLSSKVLQDWTLDPFYVSDARDPTYVKFVDFITKNW